MRYVFADCLLDTQLYTLYRAGLAISLRPKVYHVLSYLLEHRDHLVSKEELCAHVWPAQFISDATIEGCIRHVRQTIGDTGRAQQLIQTSRGYGYRFVGTVETRSEPSPPQTPTGTLQHAPAASMPDDTQWRPGPAPLPGEAPVASGAGAASPALRASLAPRTVPATVPGVPVGEHKLVTLARLVGQDVRLEEVAPVPVPGEPLPGRTYQVVGLRSQDVSGAKVERRARSPFVGCDHELATLHAVLAQVVRGRGQAVGLMGEPGIGKSRLLAEWRQQQPARGVIPRRPVSLLWQHPTYPCSTGCGRNVGSHRLTARTPSPRRCTGGSRQWGWPWPPRLPICCVCWG